MIDPLARLARGVAIRRLGAADHKAARGQPSTRTGVCVICLCPRTATVLWGRTEYPLPS